MPIPVYFTPKMVAESGSPSPSAAKPAKVVESWKRQFDIKIVEPVPVSIDDLARAHDRMFVHNVLSCKADNGFENKSPAVAAALPYTSGAMLSAARHVLVDKGVAAAPCSGFHHAEFRKAMGYCTFNGLMVTALALRADSPSIRVGILDLDMHYGNGTDDIIAVTKSSDWVTHFTGGALYQRADQVPEFFESRLGTVLRSMRDCDIVLYQAGADPHIDDPHGGWLTTDELRKRDCTVFDYFERVKVPVVWNLAGGYQIEADGSIPKVLEIHDNTMRECVRVFGSPGAVGG